MKYNSNALQSKSFLENVWDGVKKYTIAPVAVGAITLLSPAYAMAQDKPADPNAPQAQVQAPVDPKDANAADPKAAPADWEMPIGMQLYDQFDLYKTKGLVKAEGSVSRNGNSGRVSGGTVFDGVSVGFDGYRANGKNDTYPSERETTDLGGRFGVRYKAVRLNGNFVEFDDNRDINSGDENSEQRIQKNLYAFGLGLELPFDGVLVLQGKRVKGEDKTYVLLPADVDVNVETDELGFLARYEQLLAKGSKNSTFGRLSGGLYAGFNRATVDGNVNGESFDEAYKVWQVGASATHQNTSSVEYADFYTDQGDEVEHKAGGNIFFVMSDSNGKVSYGATAGRNGGVDNAGIIFALAPISDVAINQQRAIELRKDITLTEEQAAFMRNDYLREFARAGIITFEGGYREVNGEPGGYGILTLAPIDRVSFVGEIEGGRQSDWTGTARRFYKGDATVGVSVGKKTEVYGGFGYDTWRGRDLEGEHKNEAVFMLGITKLLD